MEGMSINPLKNCSGSALG